MNSKLKGIFAMLMSILKIFLPSAQKMSEMAAKKIQESVNSATAGKEDVVSKYAEFADEATTVAKTITLIMKDGKIDDEERAALAEMLSPLFEKALTLVK